MLSKTTVFLVAALLHTSVFCDTEENLPAYDSVAQCFKYAYKYITDLETVIRGKPNIKTELYCQFGKELRSCLGEPFWIRTGSSDFLDIFRALQWQRAVLESKSKLCTVFTHLERLKRRVVKSGIIEKENLVSIENDTYEACDGEFFRQCALGAEGAFEYDADIVDVALGFVNYFNEKNTPQDCQTPMMQHMKELTQAVKVYLQKKQGLLARLLHND